MGVAVLLWLPDSPVKARILSKEERIAAIERVRDDQGGTANRHWKKDQIIEAFTDLRTWLVVLSVMMSTFSVGLTEMHQNTEECLSQHPQRRTE